MFKIEIMSTRAIAFSFLGLCLLHSCISVSKFEEMQAAKEYWEQESDTADSLRQEIGRMEEETRASDAQLAACFHDSEQLEATNRNLINNFKDLEQRYHFLVEKQKVVYNAGAVEREILTEENARTLTDLDAKERELFELEGMLTRREEALYRTQGEMNDLQNELNEREQRINELTDQLNQQGQLMDRLENSIGDDLGDFASSDLEISGANGRVTVGLSESLLFSSGSDVIGAKGKAVIKQLAGTFNGKTYSNLGILIEGHTDSDGSTAANWELSLKRAAAVTEELVKSGVRPERITAAGRGMHDPLVPNNSTANKAKNRRVEIILSPDYNILFGRASN
jgi:chemotaxis protein MotB